jgi:ankyrin repeat protein
MADRPEDYFDTPADREMAAAVARGDSESVDRLIVSGAVDPLSTGRRSMTWLAIAIAAEQSTVFEQLLEHGALGPGDGPVAGTAMYTAILKGGARWLRRLLNAGASPDGRGGGDRLLVIAMQAENDEAFDALLQAGADPDAETKLGGNAALSAAYLERFDLANRLLDAGASPWVMDDLGATLGFVAEDSASTPGWVQGSPSDAARRRLLRRLQTVGFPSPAPTPPVGRNLRETGAWPPIDR